MKYLAQLHGFEQVARGADAPGVERLVRALFAQPQGVQQVRGHGDLQVGQPRRGPKENLQRRLAPVQQNLGIGLRRAHANDQVAVRKRFGMLWVAHHIVKDFLHYRIELFLIGKNGHFRGLLLPTDYRRLFAAGPARSDDQRPAQDALVPLDIALDGVLQLVRPRVLNDAWPISAQRSGMFRKARMFSARLAAFCGLNRKPLTPCSTSSGSARALAAKIGLAHDIASNVAMLCSSAELGMTNRLGFYQQAIEFYQQWLEIARKISDRTGEAIALGNLGNIYESTRQYQQAIEFYQQWLNVVKLTGDRSGEAICLSGLGNVYDYLGQYQQAIKFYQQSLQVRKQISDHTGEANVWFNLGLVLEKINQESAAIDTYRNAKRLYQKIGFNPSVQDCNQAIEFLENKQAIAPSRFWLWKWLNNLLQLIKTGSK